MALTKSFVFHVARAYRICQHGRFLKNHPTERKGFMNYLERINLVGIRDVNEHGFDSGNPARGGTQASKSLYAFSRVRMRAGRDRRNQLNDFEGQDIDGIGESLRRLRRGGKDAAARGICEPFRILLFKISATGTVAP
jgi:hypothetical protein